MRRQNILKPFIKTVDIKLISIVAFFYLGLTIGALSCGRMNDESLALLKTGFDNYFNNRSSASFFSLFFANALNYFLLFFVVLFCGTSHIGSPLVLLTVLYKGYCDGCSLAVLYCYMGVKGIFAAAVCLLPQIIIMFVLLFLISSSAIKFSLQQNPKYRYSRQNISFKEYLGYSLRLYLISFIPLIYETISLKYLLRLF